MTLDFLPTTFPAGDATDGQYLYRSLGSFWTQIFQDKNALKGYTLSMADELIQSYYRLVEVVRQYSVKDIDLLRTERWTPLTIKKSELSKAQFVFANDGTVFGTQPASNILYANKLFRFGYPKQSDSKSVFSYVPNLKIKEIGCVTNRIISPSLMLIPGVDITLNAGVMYFNLDLFNSEYIPKTKIINEAGAAVQYKDVAGNTIDDEFVILWLYHAKVDHDDLYDNFGTLFDLKLDTSSAYKELLKALMNISVEGPTISALNIAFAALLGTPVVIEPTEKVEDIYTDKTNQYVITDKNVYKLPLSHVLDDSIIVEDTLYGGEAIADSVKVIDSQTTSAWWQSALVSDRVAFPGYVFAADVHRQLIFSNSLQTVVYADGKLTFPVGGVAEDVAAFQNYINIAEHKAELLAKLGFSENSQGALTINPLDFVFSNFFKSNSLLIKLDFYSEDQLLNFVDLLPLFKDYLPPHVYIVFYIKFSVTTEHLANLNYGLTIPDFAGTTFSMDGSVKATGNRPELPGSDPMYYKDYVNRLFCVALGPYRNGQPLHDTSNLDGIELNSAIGIKCGSLRTDIPLSVTPPGESVPRPPSTKEIPAILLIDF